jgi:hypothetical protein
MAAAGGAVDIEPTIARRTATRPTGTNTEKIG